jgi:outer membrane lipoprotein SlyB
MSKMRIVAICTLALTLAGCAAAKAPAATEDERNEAREAETVCLSAAAKKTRRWPVRRQRNRLGLTAGGVGGARRAASVLLNWGRTFFLNRGRTFLLNGGEPFSALD